MRVRAIDVEGTPGELAQLPDVQELLRGFTSRSAVGSVMGDREDSIAAPVNGGDGLPDELRNFIAVRAGSRGRAEIVQEWVQQVLGSPAEAEIGTSRTSSDGLNNYLRLYARGPRRLGAFAYVTPGTGKVTFRLLREDAEGFDHATFRNVRPGTGYEVAVALTSDAACEEAAQLAQKALERVQS